jgi:hypothetical protein
VESTEHRLVVYRLISDGVGKRIVPLSNPVSISLTGTRIIGEVSLDDTRVTGEGGWADPRLVFPLQITLNPSPAGASLAVTEVTCSLHLTTPASEQNQLGLAQVVKLTYGFTCRAILGGPSKGQIQARIPLNQALIAQLERRRHQDSQHVFSASLRLQPTVAWLEQTGNTTPDEFGEHPFMHQQFGPFSRLAYFWYPQVGDLEVRIPASVWIQQVLPGLGYDQVRYAEIRLPESSLLPTEILGYYDTARRHFDLGNYREAVASCRDIRNAVERHLGATQAHPVSAIAVERLGLTADAPQRAILAAAWETLRVATNEAHHVPGGLRLTEADARMCLHLTAIVLEYLALLR